MAGQETLIYIDENDQLDAGISAKNFAKEDIQNRAYYNTLGAKLVKKYLASENVDVSNVYNIHTSRKILEEFDISDVMLENIHIDVRVVFNENFIFIPKSHYDYDILPDIYLVLLMSNDKKYMKVLGFFEPKLINKNNQNEDYYFIEKEKLTSAANLKDFIENFNGNTSQKLSNSEIENSDMMILSLADNDIDNQSKKQLLKNLVKSAELRDRFIEFENFELLAYKAQNATDVAKPAEFDITFDKAATATAAALEIYNSSTTSENDISASETDIMNSFNDLERNIPDLTPDDASAPQQEAAIDELSEFSELSDLPDFADFEDLTVAEAAEKNINPIKNIITINDKNTDLEIISDIVDETTDAINSSDTAEKTPVNIEDFVSLDLNAHDEETLTETIDLETIEMPITDISDNVEVLPDTSDLNIALAPKTADIEGEIINFEDMPKKTETKKTEDEIISETVDFDEISQTFEPIEYISTDETVPETVDFEDIAKTEDDDDFSVGFDEEPVLNLENFENLSLDDISVENTQKSEFDLNTKELDTIENETGEELQKEPEMFIEEPLNEELSLDTDLTLNEETLTETADNKPNKNLSIEDELGINETLTKQHEDVILDSIENLMLEDEKAHSTEEITNNTVVDDDKELDMMLDLENITSDTAETSIEPEPETLFEDEKTTADADEITDLNLESEEIQKSTESDEIEIEDFKELGIGVEELPTNNENTEVETNDLISQIDDLLGNSEKTNEIEENKYSDDDDKLEMLFSTGEVHDSGNVISSLDEKEDEDFNESPEITQESISGQQEKGKKAIIVAGALVALLAVAGGAGMFLKNKNAESDMISQNPIENDTINLPQAGTDPTTPADNTDLMTGTTGPASPSPKPANTTSPAPKTNKDVANKPTNAQTSKPAQTGTPLPYVSVKSIVWEVPDYLSYSDKVKKYLQSAGKSIRLSLSSDLLLATEYAYSNQVKVELKLKNDGTVESAQITKSSGSNQINDIVLRTVKSTLKVVKPAPGEIPTANFKLGLIINL